METLVKRLREHAKDPIGDTTAPLMLEAASRIEQLERQLKPPETKDERERRFMAAGLCWCGCNPGFCPH